MLNPQLTDCIFVLPLRPAYKEFSSITSIIQTYTGSQQSDDTAQSQVITKEHSHFSTCYPSSAPLISFKGLLQSHQFRIPFCYHQLAPPMPETGCRGDWTRSIFVYKCSAFNGNIMYNWLLLRIIGFI
ncbi:hypothetical protein CDAR_304131 [Caerostris darwini]|uniref:Uncharacterized protein n=1 Tax=Caerostris darwini TaxID=1538125 RepID=A0AAV4W9Q6_9ARAC|nr:hypothetical protein CDAR_304131 [Caerostris darwini]